MSGRAGSPPGTEGSLSEDGCRAGGAGGQGTGMAPGSWQESADQLVREQKVTKGTKKNRSEGKATRPGARGNENMLTDGWHCTSQSAGPSCGGIRWPGPQAARRPDSLYKGLSAPSVLNL